MTPASPPILPVLEEAKSTLPTWAAYLIAILFVAVFMLMGVCGTLLLSDRNSIAENTKEMKTVVAEIIKHDNERDKILDKVCILIMQDYTTRVDTLKKNPDFFRRDR